MVRTWNLLMMTLKLLLINYTEPEDDDGEISMEGSGDEQSDKDGNIYTDTSSTPSAEPKFLVI